MYICLIKTIFSHYNRPRLLFQPAALWFIRLKMDLIGGHRLPFKDFCKGYKGGKRETKSVLYFKKIFHCPKMNVEMGGKRTRPSPDKRTPLEGCIFCCIQKRDKRFVAPFLTKIFKAKFFEKLFNRLRKKERKRLSKNGHCLKNDSNKKEGAKHWWSKVWNFLKSKIFLQSQQEREGLRKG